MMSGARSRAMWVAAAAGLEVVTGAGLVVAPSLLARLLFGSEMNASGNLVGRIAGLVMLCLARVLAARVRGRRPAGARAAYRAEPARHRLSYLRRHGRDERWRAALAGRRGSPHPCDPAGARLDEPAGGRMTHRREAEKPWARCQ